MPTPTYDLIEEKVLASAQASVVFNSIPNTYKDLVLEGVLQSANASAVDNLFVRMNGDTSSLYSTTALADDGGFSSNAKSFRATNVAQFRLGTIPSAFVGSKLATFTVNVFSYTNTNVNRTALARLSNAMSDVTGNGDDVTAVACLYRSTTAITSLTIYAGSNIASGSTFRLWGVA